MGGASPAPVAIGAVVALERSRPVLRPTTPGDEHEGLSGAERVGHGEIALRQACPQRGAGADVVDEVVGDLAAGRALDGDFPGHFGPAIAAERIGSLDAAGAGWDCKPVR